MALTKYYDPQVVELRLGSLWEEMGIYRFSPETPGEVYSIDTDPPTVSGNLHLGHTFSYSHTDFMARFWRMQGRKVFYPMGFDDNGIPTERLVEKRLNVRATEIGRQAFIEKCIQVSEEVERDYEALWRRLGLSIDWQYTYRTIDELSRRTSQLSFIDLYHKGLAYRQEAPAIWCPECQASFAQADLNDLERESEYVTLDFRLEEGESLPIATTRPELLPACVAIFVHPADRRYQNLVGKHARVPLFGQTVPILTDPGADPEKGTGVVMCCTFGDTADVAWWRTHHLPLVQVVGRDGRLNESAGEYAGLSLVDARLKIKQDLQARGLILEVQPTVQSVRVHERCDTPVEYLMIRQWFIRLLEYKKELLEAGEKVNWYPPLMKARYRLWVENLNWDWCISRQRYFGVPFPVWYCSNCGEVILADEASLPVDPLEQEPATPCPRCGGQQFEPEKDIFDTWATSSVSPQIVGRWLEPNGQWGKLYGRVFPFSLRPQAHDIIRTWAFYTLAKSHFHFGVIPWKDVSISGWAIAGEGMGKISKSRGGGPMPPKEMIQKYSADAVRYWSASTGLGKDAVISEEKIQAGARLVTKLWNVARFSERFIQERQNTSSPTNPIYTPADRWILARLQHLVRRTTDCFLEYDYATAKSEVEAFFWRDLADNYLEMCKQRLYDINDPTRSGALEALNHVVSTLLKLFAPILPYVTEEIYLGLYGSRGESPSIHTSAWPLPDPTLEDAEALSTGEMLVEIATAVRRYKSLHNLPLGAELSRLQLATADKGLISTLNAATGDLGSITRARQIDILARLDPAYEVIKPDGTVMIAIEHRSIEEQAKSD